MKKNDSPENQEWLRQLYSEILRIRMIEEELVRRYSEQEMRCPVHFSIGQEAIAVGVCQTLLQEDSVLSGHRSHAHYLARGGDLKRMICELYGKAAGCSSGKGGSMHLIDRSVNFLGSTSIVAGTIPVAVGVAFANKLKKSSGTVVMFFGDAATEEGLFYESANFASLHKLPILFVCENNLYSVYSPLEVRQSSLRKNHLLAESLGMKASGGLDGNDVPAVYEAVQSAMDSIRSEVGPVFLEFNTYRWLEHCGPGYDNDIGYRTDEEFQKWKREDPLEVLEKRIKVLSSGCEDFKETERKKFQSEISEAISCAKEAPFPAEQTLSEGVYASKG
ncbi:MAG TPA: thiamine pyrophosphate-dependent dehydrogenase E1 component subunit alpha [Verrucomicrobia bacterium]|nr:thiamine pyrophosphate-dependent dehydrogenase E1 component subunit alpha [Verrucomicrobiota bacterium]